MKCKSEDAMEFREEAIHFFVRIIGYWRLNEWTGDMSEDYTNQNNPAILAAAPYAPAWIDSGAPLTPELPSFYIPPHFMIASSAAIIVFKGKCPRPSEE